jgi:mannose-6-phosphate isomerase-like protein (cupin superfamily)
MIDRKDVVDILNGDGIIDTNRETFSKYENVSSINLEDLRKDLGMGSWAARIAYNDVFGGVVLQQQPGEGNRKHMHPDADENWVILDGEWEWWIDGIGTSRVKTNDIIVVPKQTWHQITCIGDFPGVRYAVTKPDVLHRYKDA